MELFKKFYAQEMKKIFLALIIFLGGLLISCESFLDRYPHSEVAMEEVLQSEEDFEVALRGVYAGFKSPDYYGRYFTVYPDVMTDEVVAVVGFTNQLGILHNWAYNALDADIKAMWRQMYSVIARANTIINQIDGIDGEEENLKQIKGEALTARALAHFDLVRLFAKSYSSSASADWGIPYMTEFVTSEPNRDNLSIVYSSIIDDLEEALTLMSVQENDSPYLTPAAAEALLARIYLYMGEWEQAIIYAEKVINEGTYGYALASGDDFANMWINDTGSEIIWKVGLTANDAAGKFPGYNYYNDSQGKPNPDYIPTDNFLAIYDTAKDIRYQTYFVTEETNNGVDLILCRKYPTNPDFASIANANGANMPKVFRLAEQYLICAEAYAELDFNDEAWSYIQDLRAQRIEDYDAEADPVPVNLKEEIFNERKRELAFEGHLWFDYKRKGLGFTRQGRTGTGNNQYANSSGELVISADNYRWLLPVPQDEINANEGIKDQQNPDY